MSLVALLAIAGTGGVAVGGVVCLRRTLLAWGLGLQAAGLAAIGSGGLVALLGRSAAGSAFSGDAGLTFGIDPLTGFFLAALAVSGVPALVFAIGYLPGTIRARAVGVLTAGFLLAMVGVLAARTAPAFLTSWELMTLLPAGAILVVRREPKARRSVFEYLAITHVGGVGVWVSLLLLVSHGALEDTTAVQALGAPLQAFIGLAAVVGFGAKAGIMPFHSWLPRAHPLAPSHISALMSGMMIKVALYGLIRVLFEWLGGTPLWLALILLCLGVLSSLGGVVYALFQHELKRLLAFHSIENVGIIVLGLGAALLFQDRGQPGWAALAFAAALLHVLNHAVFKGLLFLGAGSIDKMVHGLEIDRLGGLLRRMPWTGGAFLIGSMAIAGLPPLNGFVSEWLTLQALVHVVTGSGAAGTDAAQGSAWGSAIVGTLATMGLAMTAALAVFCFAKVVGLVLLGRPRRAACEAAREVSAPMVAATTTLAVLCVGLGLLPGLLLPSLARLAPGGEAAAGLFSSATASVLPWNVGVPVTGTGGLPTLGLGLIMIVLVALLVLARGRRRAAPAPVWTCGQRVEHPLDWTSAGFTKPLRLVLEVVLRPERAVTLETKNHITQRLTYSGSVPHLFDTKLYRPVVRWALAAAAHARRLQSGSLRAYMAYLLALIIVALAVAWLWGADESPRTQAMDMSGADIAAGAVQVVGGIAIAPVLPGLTQHLKARLQGRQGPSPLQPYREIARLWSKSAVDPEGSTVLYRLAPPVVAASLAVSLLLIPMGGHSLAWPVGHDALLLVGLFALARFALAMASWDTGSGFALMGSSRDLTVGVAVEGLLLLVLVLAALPLGSTDLRSLSDAAAGATIWSLPVHWLAAAGFALVVIAETGRQPVDNPDTHLELTMIHEGPLLEYAGRDLAYLQWAAAARHWIMLVLALELFAPHPAGFLWRMLILVVGLPALCAVLAVVESWQAKLRLLRVPRLLGVGACLCLLGLVSWLIGGRL